MPLTILRRGRRRPATQGPAVLFAYRQALEPLLTRVRAIRDGWVDLSYLERDAERLANAAAVYRWELARLAPPLADVAVPELAATVHHDLRVALKRATRGCQLLATGRRSHNSKSVCDGQSLLLESADLFESTVRRLDEIVNASAARNAC